MRRDQEFSKWGNRAIELKWLTWNHIALKEPRPKLKYCLPFLQDLAYLFINYYVVKNISEKCWSCGQRLFITLKKIVNMIDTITIDVSNTETFWGHKRGSTYLPLEIRKRTKNIYQKINQSLQKLPFFLIWSPRYIVFIACYLNIRVL